MKIAWATANDAEAITPLLAALHLHDTAEVQLPGAEALLRHARLLTDSSTPHRLAIAWNDDGSAIGLAAVGRFVSVSDLRPQNVLQFELKELFVLPQARGRGTGAALLAWIEQLAREEGVCRIDWHVKRHNGRGIEFYRRFGGSIMEDRLSMRKWVRA
jgi:GNAT superfamily N-acetyltransferase